MADNNLIEIILRLVDEVSSGAKPATEALADIKRIAGETGEQLGVVEDKAGDAAGGLGEVQSAAPDAAEGIGDVGEAAEETGNKVNPLERILKRVFSIGALLLAARRGIGMFQDSVQRLADSGDQNAINMQADFGKLGESLSKIVDAFVKNLLPALAWIAEKFGNATDGVQNYSTEEQKYAADTIARWNQLKAEAETMTGARRRAVDGQIAALEDQALAEIKAGIAASDSARAAEEGAARWVSLLPAQQEVSDRLARGHEKAREQALRLRDAAGETTPTFGEWAQKISAAAYKAGDLAKQLNDAHQATEDLKLAQLDGVLAIAEFGRQMDEALIQKGPMTAETVERLVKGLFDAASNAEDLGNKVPLTQVEDLKTRSGNLTEILAKMDVPPEVKAALQAYLDLINEKLAAAESRAKNAQAAMAGMEGGGAKPQPPGTVPIADEYGGMINEPIVGRGVQSGRRYTFGERGVVEEVRPVAGAGDRGGSGAGRPIIVHTHIYLDGRQIAEAVGEAIEMRGGA